ncbi:MAG: GspE/PulE family protein [Firmicutes bacterium]|nr:GspE/PulE family protein [Bacillota bacterium]
MAYKRLGDMLVGIGLLTEQQLASALAEQKKNGKKLGTVLVENGYIRQQQLFDALQRQLGVDFVDLTSVTPAPELARVLPRSIAKKYSIVPVRGDSNTLYIALDDPLNFVAVEAAKTATRRKIIPMLATSEGVERAIANLYGSEGAEKAIAELKDEEDASGLQSMVSANIIGADNENAAPTIRLVNSILEYAVNQNASDIHLEPREREMVVRMRIDGVLRKAFTVPKGTQNAVIARIKVMGNMNIAEHKIPLDGRSNIRIGERDIDLRISTLPTVYGEKTVIRLLYKSSSLLSTKGIGLTGKNLKKFNALLENSNGVILIVGPTGSGKSSSMYTMIRQLNTDEVNLVTLEDPVEYNLDGVNQVQINEKVDMTFANGLRSILRQDPDIIAVGEIRDGETAQIAMRAAITGHLVLSTLHTNDAPSTLDRLLDMGVEPYLVSTALKGIISQRLVRRICPNCRTEYTPSAEEQQMLHLPVTPGRRFYKGKGCPACMNTGYRCRTAVFEILVITSEIKRAIADNVPHSELMRIIEASDFEPLISDCVRLVTEGVTTVSEAYRTVNSTDA